MHEWHDDQRTAPLISKLRESGMILNPPIIAPLQDGTERYMVLDGANRTTAISKMGIPHIIAQVVEPSSDAVDLRTWNHVLWDWDTEEFLNALKGISEIKLDVIDEDEGLRKLWNRLALVWLQTPDGTTYLASCDEDLDLVTRLDLLNQVVDTYKSNAQLDRTRIRKVAALEQVYNGLCALIVFPHFDIEEVIDLTSQGHLFPSGLTRFSVSPRALRINFPLRELSCDKPINEKNAELQAWINGLIASKSVRMYTEATVLFDE